MRLKVLSIDACVNFATSPGSAIHVDYRPKILDRGSFRLEACGQTDIHKRILAEVPLTDINYILTRLAQGDSSVLNSSAPMFGDFTAMPQTMAEALQMVIDGERAFNSLPLDVRDKFSQDYRKWFSTAGSPHWLEVMSNAGLVSLSGSDNNLSFVSSGSSGMEHVTFSPSGEKGAVKAE